MTVEQTEKCQENELSARTDTAIFKFEPSSLQIPLGLESRSSPLVQQNWRFSIDPCVRAVIQFVNNSYLCGISFLHYALLKIMDICVSFQLMLARILAALI